MRCVGKNKNEFTQPCRNFHGHVNKTLLLYTYVKNLHGCVNHGNLKERKKSVKSA